MTEQAQQSTAVAAVQAGPMDTFRKLFGRPDVLTSLATVAPKHLTPDRITKIALSAMSRNPKLLECTQGSLLKAIMQAAELGLEPGGILGHAYLVPFWNSKAAKGRGSFECVLITGYKGKVELARRSGLVSSLVARVVFERDAFTWEYGLDEKLVHKPYAGAEDPGRMTHVYAVATLKDGTKVFDVLSAPQVEQLHQRSQGYKTAKAKGWTENSPWVTDPLEMAKKSAVHRLSKYLPLAPDKPEHAGFLKAQIAEERAESGGWTGNVYSIDPEDEDTGDVVAGSVVPSAPASPLDVAAENLGAKGAGLATGDGPNPNGPPVSPDQQKLLDDLTGYLVSLSELATAQAFAHNHRVEIAKLDAKHRELFAIVLKSTQEKLRNGKPAEEKPKRGKGKAAQPALPTEVEGQPVPSATTGALPGQCDACYVVDGHKPGCPNGPDEATP